MNASTEVWPRVQPQVVHLHGVPDHHIGMYAVPLDDRTVIVGDPDLAKPFWSSKLDQTYGKAYFSAQISDYSTRLLLN